MSGRILPTAAEVSGHIVTRVLWLTDRVVASTADSCICCARNRGRRSNVIVPTDRVVKVAAMRQTIGSIDSRGLIPPCIISGGATRDAVGGTSSGAGVEVDVDFSLLRSKGVQGRRRYGEERYNDNNNMQPNYYPQR